MYLGIKAPEIFLSNTISKRKKSMERAYPNTLDLLLICVESGMSIEHAFRKVSMEVGTQSIPMAEMTFCLRPAEMSFLPDRRTASQIWACAPGWNPSGGPSSRCWCRPSATERRSAPRCACCHRKVATRAR